MAAARYTIYCHTCRVTGKKYVGQTVGTVRQRWTGHVSEALNRRDDGCEYFHRAIRKYGRDAFISAVLSVKRSRRAANEAEKEWIRKLCCRAPLGYNLDEGGGAGPRHPETRRKISETRARMPPEEKAALSARLSEAQRRTPPEVRKAKALQRELRWRCRVGDPLVERVRALLDGSDRPERLEVKVISQCLGMTNGRGDQIRIGSALKRLGYTPVRVYFNRKKQHLYEKPGELAPRVVQDAQWHQQRVLRAAQTRMLRRHSAENE